MNKRDSGEYVCSSASGETEIVMLTVYGQAKDLNSLDNLDEMKQSQAVSELKSIESELGSNQDDDSANESPEIALKQGGGMRAVPRFDTRRGLQKVNLNFYFNNRKC